MLLAKRMRVAYPEQKNIFLLYKGLLLLKSMCNVCRKLEPKKMGRSIEVITKVVGKNIGLGSS